MRFFVYVVLFASLLVACSPQEAGNGLVKKSGLDVTVTGNVVAEAFEEKKTCSEDIECTVGRICVNMTCVPKNPSAK